MAPSAIQTVHPPGGAGKDGGFFVGRGAGCQAFEGVEQGGAAGSEASWQDVHGAATGEDWIQALGPYLAGIEERHPRLTAHIREVWTRETAEVVEQRFDYGLSCVLDGIEARRPR